MLGKLGRLLFGNNKAKVSRTYNSNMLNLFLASIDGVGHTDYSILSSQYSPDSRIPCTDLVPFISERIAEGDTNSIKLLMRAVIEANPGIGFGPKWIDGHIENILSIPFENYISFPSDLALLELKALFIVNSKSGSSNEFMLTDKVPILLSWACIAHQPSWSTNLYSLAEKANYWVEKMAKETPYWQGYEKFIIKEAPSKTIDAELRERILKLTPAARLQLFYAVETGGGSLLNLTNFQIRNLGINTNKTSKELLDSELLTPSCSSESIESAYSKKELVGLCETYGITHRKSWTKRKIVEALKEIDPLVLGEITRTMSIVSPNSLSHPELKNIVRIADEHLIGFKLLCFA